MFEELGLDKAEDIILSGGSAGGIAAYSWMNEFKEILNEDQNLYVLPDSSYFN